MSLNLLLLDLRKQWLTTRVEDIQIDNDLSIKDISKIVLSEQAGSGFLNFNGSNLVLEAVTGASFADNSIPVVKLESGPSDSRLITDVSGNIVWQPFPASSITQINQTITYTTAVNPTNITAYLSRIGNQVTLQIKPFVFLPGNIIEVVINPNTFPVEYRPINSCSLVSSVLFTGSEIIRLINIIVDVTGVITIERINGTSFGADEINSTHNIDFSWIFNV